MPQSISNLNSRQVCCSQPKQSIQRNNNLSKLNHCSSLSFKGNNVSEYKKFINNFRRGFEYNMYYLHPKAVKEIFNDPKAFLYRFFNDLNLIETSRKKMGNLMLQLRKNAKPVRGCIKKISHTNGMERYFIERNGLRLGQIDTTKKIKNDKEIYVYINYITNIIGRKKYKGLEKQLLQAVLEDSIQGGRLPIVDAVPAEIGKNQFSRSVLYRNMGAETITIPSLKRKTTFDIIDVPPETIKKHTDLLMKRQNFILPETEQNIQKLRQNQGWQ